MLPTAQTSDLSDFRWNAVAGRYIDSDGQFVSFVDVRNELENVIEAAKASMNTLSQGLLDSKISLAEWQAGMMENIRLVHVCSGASANGGWAQMSQSDWGFVGQRIRTQYEYLRNFASQIANGTQPLNGQVLVRSNMYGDAGRATFEETRRRYQRLNNGMEEELRELGEADHCPGCLDQAGLGWQLMGILDPIGAEECLTNCHCRFKYRRKGPDGEWIESEGE